MQRSLASYLFVPGRAAAMLCVLATLAPTVSPAQGIDNSINQTVWKLLYGVSDAKLNDPNWLAADDDGDGLSNANELAAGTNPFSAASTFKLSSSSLNNDGSITLSFPTTAGKSYVVQTSTDLTSAANWTTTSPTLSLVGDGNPQSITVPPSSGTPFFCRVVVQDIDTDGDGVSDWAEKVTGFDPTTAYTHGATEDDHTALVNDLATENVISITATKSTATQPPNLSTAATDLGTITISRGGTLHFSTITVPLTWSGTAVMGADYAAMPMSVTFPPKVGVITLNLTPLANSAQRTGTVATVSAVAGAGFSTPNRGTPVAASVSIAPAGNANGTGLTGYYFLSDKTTINAGYVPANLFNPSKLQFSRLDPTVDFTWTTTSPGTQLPLTYYTVRWLGQVQPQYSETYYFDTKTDDGVKLWVNNQLIIDGWSYQSADRVAGIALQAGVLYDIRMEFYQATSSSLAHLYWYSPSQSKQIIPANRLYPDSTTVAPPAITSAPTAVGFVNQPFTFPVTASTSGGTSLTFSIGLGSAALPAGLTLNAATGLISGTPTVAGEYQIALAAANSSGVGAGVLDIQILNPGSGVTRELWTTTVTGSGISDIPINTAPTSIDTALVTPEDNTSYPAQTGERLRGYFTAPTTGNYFFWISANNVAELWVSDSAEPVSGIKRAWVTAPGTGVEVWNDSNQSHQRSPWLALTAGQRYYYEVLHNTGGIANSGNVALGAIFDATGTSTTPVVSGNSGVAPGYLLYKYDYPTAVATAGSLYVTNLSPQGTSVSSANGSANLRLSPDSTQAILHFSYSGLTSPRTAYHIHMAADATSSGQIVFDLDDVDKFHPELKTADGGYIWNIAAVGSITTAQIVSALQQGFCYFNVHTVNFPNGEIRGNLGIVQGSQNPPVAVADPGFSDDSATDAGAARFLNQAAYGAAPSDLTQVQSGGYAAWINSQIALTATHLYPDVLAHQISDPQFPFQAKLVDNAWWRAAVTAPDQLRQRVAFALSEILVASSSNATLTNQANAMAVYYDALVDGAFGNFRDVLTAMTLNPAMGYFLNMQGNAKGDLTTGLHPNENYAREIMQLFSIGLNRLWPDGTLVLDSQGNLVPTYSQSSITGAARVFTGWTWSQTPAGGTQPTSFYPKTDWVDPMVVVPSYHELGTKLLLDNVVAPAAIGYNFPAANTTGSAADPTTALCNAYCQADLSGALDSIFNHPNVGPYICRQLIQRLVTGNPSPAYLYRVVQKFNDDGGAQHVRGNLAATVRAILLDGEARNVAAGTNTSGKQREPLLRIAAPARTFPYTASSGTYSQSAGSPIINVTLSAGSPTNRLASGDGVALDFSGNASGNPPTQPANNPVNGAYTVLASPAPTTTSFAVTALDLVNVGYTITAPTQVTPSTNLTVKTSGPSVQTINGSKLYGEVYLQFVPAGGPDGIYTVGDPSGSNLQVSTASAPSSATTSTVIVPKVTGGYVITNPTGSTASTISFETLTNHNLNAGNRFWLDVSSGSSTQIIPQEFTVSSVVDSFNFTVNNTVVYKNETNRSQVLYPLTAPPEARSGVVTQAASKFDMGATDSTLVQTPIESPTVFNFFYPDYKYAGQLAAANVTTPEFQLTTDTNVITLTNTINSTFLASGNPSGLCSFNGGSILFDLSPYMSSPYSVADVPGVSALIDKLGNLLTGGQLTSGTKNEIVNYVTGSTVVNGKSTANFPTTSSTNVRDRVRAVVQQIVISPEYAIQR